jgi:hypothetical protein
VPYAPRNQAWVNQNQSGGTSLANAIDAEDLNRLEGNDADFNSRLQAIEAGGGTAVPADGSVTNAKVAAGAAISLDKTADSVSRLAMTSAERSKLATLQLGGIVSGYVPSGSTTPSIVHALGTVDLLVSVHEEAGGGFVSVAAATTDINTVALTFAVAPTANQYRYTIASKSALLAAPQVRDIPLVQAYAASLTLNAAAGNNRIMTATGSVTLNEPANGQDGQLLRLTVIASGAQRVVTFNAALKRPSSIVQTLTIASGQRGHIGLSYESTYGWTVMCAFSA